MNYSISLLLHTLKAESASTQIETITLLSQMLLHLYDEIVALIQTTFSGTVLKLEFSGDPNQLVQLAMLTIVAADISTVPHRDGRTFYHATLYNTLSHFGLSEADLRYMIPLCSQLETIFQAH